MDISKSKLTRDLLGFYFANADKKFYLRELERILHHSVGNIRRQLQKFEKSGLFNTSRTGNLVFYGLNKSYHLYDELKSIVTKTVGVTGVLKEALSKIRGIKIAFMYGSFAKETEDEQSDIDVCVVGEPDHYKLIKILNSLEEKLQREINYTLFSENEFRIKAKEKGSFINLIIKSKILPLKGDISTYA
jgi:predicted nucleotidyltransferase